MTEKIRAGRRTADQRLSVEYAHDLEAARRAAGGTVESWIVEGAGHVEAMNLHPEEYEAGWSSS